MRSQLSPARVSVRVGQQNASSASDGHDKNTFCRTRQSLGSIRKPLDIFREHSKVSRTVRIWRITMECGTPRIGDAFTTGNRLPFGVHSLSEHEPASRS